MTRPTRTTSSCACCKRPLTGVYLSFFLMMTLMILVGATWMGLYLAKRITRPVQMLPAAAREIGAGHLDHRIEPETARRVRLARRGVQRAWPASWRRAGASSNARTLDLERKNLEVEGRRRYIETILERIATGVVSVDADGRDRRRSTARRRGCSASIAARRAAGARRLRPRGPRSRCGRCSATPRASAAERPPQEIALAARRPRDPPRRRADALARRSGGAEGAVLVLRRRDAAHPVAEGGGVARGGAPAGARDQEPADADPAVAPSACGGISPARRPRTQALVDECTTTIVGEVESLKGLVDEFSQFARMPAPRAVPTDLHALLDDTLALYNGLFSDVRIEQRVRRRRCRCVRVDAGADPARRHQPGRQRHRGDGAAAGVDRASRRAHDAGEQRGPRLVVADNGPGIPPAERDKLFMPYYSTKRRGSGLGLAIVRRIVAEHGGSIEVARQRRRAARGSRSSCRREDR